MKLCTKSNLVTSDNVKREKYFKGRCSKLSLAYCLFLAVLKTGNKTQSCQSYQWKKTKYKKRENVCKPEKELDPLNHLQSVVFSTKGEQVSKCHIFFQHRHGEEKSPNPPQEYEKYLQNISQNILITHTNEIPFERTWNDKRVLKY